LYFEKHLNESKCYLRLLHIMKNQHLLYSNLIVIYYCNLSQILRHSFYNIVVVVVVVVVDRGCEEISQGYPQIAVIDLNFCRSM
jgi:hypothetical protein